MRGGLQKFLMPIVAEVIATVVAVLIFRGTLSRLWWIGPQLVHHGVPRFAARWMVGGIAAFVAALPVLSVLLYVWFRLRSIRRRCELLGRADASPAKTP